MPLKNLKRKAVTCLKRNGIQKRHQHSWRWGRRMDCTWEFRHEFVLLHGAPEALSTSVLWSPVHPPAHLLTPSLEVSEGLAGCACDPAGGPRNGIKLQQPIYCKQNHLPSRKRRKLRLTGHVVFKMFSIDRLKNMPRLEMEPAKLVGALHVRRCHQDLSHCWFLGKPPTASNLPSAFAPNPCLSVSLPKLDQAAGSCGERSNCLHAHPGEDLRKLAPKLNLEAKKSTT